jgi:serine/threonine-protein kinase RsbT
LVEIIHQSFEIAKDDLDRAGEASSSVKKLLQKLGVNPACIKKVAISVYEIEINAVIHAGGGVMEVYIYPSMIKVEIIDNGPGIKDVDLAMKEGYSTAPDSIKKMGFGAGMGLPNAKRNADEFFIQTQLGKGTKILITVHF